MHSPLEQTSLSFTPYGPHREFLSYKEILNHSKTDNDLSSLLALLD